MVLHNGTPAAPRSTRSPGQGPGGKFSLANVVTQAKQLPPRMIFHGVGGIGKTSLAAYAPKPAFLMSKLETGALALMDAGLTPEGVGCLPECQTWDDALGWINFLTEEAHSFKTLALDVANGFEKLCSDMVCQRDYGGSWAKFNAYKAGPDVAVNDWRLFLAALDRLREKRKMVLILLAHTKVSNFRNPEGPDYDRFVPDMTPQGWAATYAWCDICAFCHYNTTLKEERQGKAKGQGGNERFIYTEHSAAWDAKNREGLPSIIPMGGDGAQAWANFKGAYDLARQSNRPAPAVAAEPQPAAAPATQEAPAQQPSA